MRDAGCVELEEQLTHARSLVYGRRRPRAIVADADDESRWWITSFLAAEGYELRQIRDGARLVNALVWCLHYPDELPDLLVVSDTLPTLGGREIVARLVRAGHRLPIILTVASGGPSSTDASLGARGVLQLRKPFGPGELRSALKQVALGTSARAYG